MRLLRKFSGAAGAAVMAGLLSTLPAQAEEPMRIIIPAPVGAGSDNVARVLAQGLAAELNTPVIVDARPGAGGAIAARLVKAAPADGRTLLLVNTHVMVTLPLTLKEPGFDPVRHFHLLGQFANTALALAVPGGTFTTLKDWLDAARTQPAAANLGVPAPGSSMDFMGFKLGKDAGVKLVSVPYRGGAPMITDLLARQIPAGGTIAPDLLEHHKSSRLKVLAVGGTERYRDLPDVPTFKEAGFSGMEQMTMWGGLAVAAGTPAPVLERLRAALRKVMLNPKTAKQLLSTGNHVDYADHEALAHRQAADLKLWGQLIKESGFVPQ
jgi:tripartite-type tricarboxylate transporter receptor subunit TctC